MSLPLLNRTNQDYVAEAVAAIPHWMAFLDEMEAEQDALIAEMRAQRQEGQGTVPPSAGGSATPKAQATPAPQSRAEAEDSPEALERGSAGLVEQQHTEVPCDPATPDGADEEPVVRSSASTLQQSNAAANEVKQRRNPAWTGRLRERGDA